MSRPGGPEGPPPARPTGGVRRLLGFLAPYWPQLIAAVIALLVASACLLAIPKAVGFLIDHAFEAGDRAVLDLALEVILGLVLLLAAAMATRTYMMSWVAERLVADVRVRVYENLVLLSPGFFERRRLGDILSRLSADATHLLFAIKAQFLVTLRSLIQLVGAVGLMFSSNAGLAALVVLVVPVVIAVAFGLGTRVRGLARLEQDRHAAVGAQIEETLAAIRTVQAFTRERAETERLRGLVGAGLRDAGAQMRTRFLFTFVAVLLMYAAIVTIVYVGGIQVLQGTISGGVLVEFVLYAVFTGDGVASLAEVYGEIVKTTGATERLFALLDERPVIAAPRRPAALPKDGTVRFDGVGFAYPARPGGRVIEDFSLTVEPGETLAIVGPSGAGKTTLFQLLLRFYDPEVGRVMLGGTDLRALDPAGLRRAIAWVPQEPVIFSGSARDNILYGCAGARPDQAVAAAKAAQIDEFLASLPDGYDTVLGEKGVQLSGGQRQRLGIARAVARDAPILLLDEATSSLDSENERAIQQALAPILATRTTLIIAHRLATVRAAHRILVMDQGRRVAEGSHQELVAGCELYARLAALQFEPAPVEPALYQVDGSPLQ